MIPGIDPTKRASINLEARRELAAWIARGVSPGRLLLRITADSAVVELRTTASEFYADAGVRVLARKIERALVPAHCVLTLTDAEAVHLTLVPLRMLLDDNAPATPARTYAP